MFKQLTDRHRGIRRTFGAIRFWDKCKMVFEWQWDAEQDVCEAATMTALDTDAY